MSRNNALNLTRNTFNGGCTFPQPACATLLCVSSMDLKNFGSSCTLFHRSGKATGAFPDAWSGTGDGESRILVPWERERALPQHCVRSGTEDVRDNWLDGLTISGFPKEHVGNGRRPVLPAVLPLAWLPGCVLRRSFAMKKFGP